MAIISKEGLLKVLASYNPWWKTGMVNPKLSKTYKRFAFYEAMKRFARANHEAVQDEIQFIVVKRAFGH